MTITWTQKQQCTCTVYLEAATIKCLLVMESMFTPVLRQRSIWNLLIVFAVVDNQLPESGVWGEGRERDL